MPARTLSPAGPGCSWRGLFLLVYLLLAAVVWAQDASTGAISGTVSDATGARVADARVTATNQASGVARSTASDSEGRFSLQMLTPGLYTLRVEAAEMAPLEQRNIRVEVGGLADISLTLVVAGRKEQVTVTAETPLVETQPTAVSSMIGERDIEELPLNGRRYTDLALLTPGVTQDPRSLTSSSNGDLAFGGVRGYQSSFLVDGADNNNAFFSQARGRYRAPYQFSNEVIQEFRVSSNTYGVELGRTGGAVINVVTKSGSNYWHGSGFYYLRDSAFNATSPYVGFQPPNRQQQFGFTVGGPLKRNRMWIFAGFDQHLFHIPTVVQFVGGASTVVPTPADYEASDQALVFASAAELSTLAGTYPSALLGNAGFFKLDWAITPRNTLSARLSTSTYYGANNVFFDSASPITNYAISDNGEEKVNTQSAVVSLTSTLGPQTMSHLRVQFSHDLQSSDPNTGAALTEIYDIIQGFGRSSILPRETNERRLHIAETVSREAGRHSFKFGGDVSLVWLYNFFPSLFGGEYIFDNIRVNPFTFVPMTFGLRITPLRAYAHEVPRYYIQNFGSAVSHPNTQEYALFAQDTIRLTGHLALSLGVRWDLQTFHSSGLVTNPLWPDSGKMPFDGNNFAPRVGLAYSLGEKKPLVIRAGAGIFYARVPQIYNSAVETDNGITQSHLFLDNADFFDRMVFPSYPAPLVPCATNATTCTATGAAAGHLSTEISAFAHDFQMPYVEQASVSAEKEVTERLAIGVNGLYVHGVHLIRALDANLPPPIVLSYPVFDASGTTFTGQYWPVASFSTWQLVPSFTCPFPPCINPLERPIPQVGSIDVFQSAASSVYYGVTVSVRRRMTRGLYFRVAYTWAQAMDSGQDALVAGRPANVQNAYAPQLERGPSVTDQRNRFVAAWVWEPAFFHHDRPTAGKLFNDWKFSGVVTVGSGRPINARIYGDANQDDNSDNDRLPGYRRNSFLGPDYFTTDLRLGRVLHLQGRWQMELLVEAFNVFNRTNQRVTISDDGFLNAAGQFVPLPVTAGGTEYPGSYQQSSSFLVPTQAYAPRQVQVAVRVKF
ncbi:MAG TPA: TonB-dependent receptor [Terriglobales bacterium]|nr:TonB-dependent receptor [Terriglobales bacterium]